MATQITADLPTLDFPKEVDYPTQEDWAAFSSAAELNFGILGGSWSTQMQLWKTQANAMSTEFNTNATIAQGLANYQGDWTSQGYILGQTVSVSGVYYICKLTHATGQNPTTGGSIYWNLAIGNWNLKVALADFTGTNISLDSNGYQKLPSGLIIQWGQSINNNSLGTGLNTLVFPIAFPNTCLSISKMNICGEGGGYNTSDASFVAGSVTTSGLTWVAYLSDNNIATSANQVIITYIAIGY